MALGAKRQGKTRQKHKVSHFYFYFRQKMEFMTYFVFFIHSLINLKCSERIPTEFEPPVKKSDKKWEKKSDIKWDKK